MKQDAQRTVPWLADPGGLALDGALRGSSERAEVAFADGLRARRRRLGARERRALDGEGDERALQPAFRVQEGGASRIAAQSRPRQLA